MLSMTGDVPMMILAVICSIIAIAGGVGALSVMAIADIRAARERQRFEMKPVYHKESKTGENFKKY